MSSACNLHQSFARQQLALSRPRARRSSRMVRLAPVAGAQQPFGSPPPLLPPLPQTPPAAADVLAGAQGLLSSGTQRLQGAVSGVRLPDVASSMQLPTDAHEAVNVVAQVKRWAGGKFRACRPTYPPATLPSLSISSCPSTWSAGSERCSRGSDAGSSSSGGAARCVWGSLAAERAALGCFGCLCVFHCSACTTPMILRITRDCYLCK